MKKLIKIYFILTAYLSVSSICYGQNHYKLATIAFYNVENLFDTEQSVDYIDGRLDPKDPLFHLSIPVDSDLARTTPFYKGGRSDAIFTKKKLRVLLQQVSSQEFTPEGSNKWTVEKYAHKLKNISKVISQIGNGQTKAPPVVVGLAEIKNRKVLEDLLSQPDLALHNYGIVHKNSYDKRGIDCALIYRKNRFQVKKFKTYEVKIYQEKHLRDYTRDILLVEGLLDGEEIYFLVNHWPSRRRGQEASKYKRQIAAASLRKIVDEIQTKNINSKLVIMGDFNDDPTSDSIKKILHTYSKRKSLGLGKLYNPMEGIWARGGGSSAYRDRWNCFDQIILSESLLRKHKLDQASYKMYRVGIFKKKYLVTSSGRFKGYPLRTFSKDHYQGGYSDHFPVYMTLIREVYQKDVKQIF